MKPDYLPVTDEETIQLSVEYYNERLWYVDEGAEPLIGRLLTAADVVVYQVGIIVDEDPPRPYFLTMARLIDIECNMKDIEVPMRKWSPETNESEVSLVEWYRGMEDIRLGFDRDVITRVWRDVLAIEVARKEMSGRYPEMRAAEEEPGVPDFTVASAEGEIAGFIIGEWI